MRYDLETLEVLPVSLEDMLEMVAAGGNGATFVDIPNLLKAAAKELRKHKAFKRHILDWKRDFDQGSVKELERILK